VVVAVEQLDASAAVPWSHTHLGEATHKVPLNSKPAWQDPHTLAMSAVHVGPMAAAPFVHVHFGGEYADVEKTTVSMATSPV
jgi:hypothetical protein